MGNSTAIKVARAFVNGQKIKSGNYESTGVQFLVFGNVIADKYTLARTFGEPEDGFYIKDCGWCTATTSNALNALPGVRLRRLKDKWIWNEERKWDGHEMFINYKN